MPPLASIHRSLRLLFWSCLVIGVVLTSLGVRQIDLWWQLPEGLSILHHGQLPVHAPAAFGLPAQPYIDEYGLYEIGLALVYQAAGFAGIGLGFAIVYLLIFLIPLAAARGRIPDLLSLWLFGMALLFMINRLEQRPEVPGVLGLVLLLGLLRGCNRFSWGFLLRLCLLLALWSNVHSSFVVGLLALFLWLADRSLLARNLPRRHALGIAFAALAAVTINPYGWNRLAFTWRQENDPGSNLLSQEMWPAFAQTSVAIGLLLAGGALLGLAFIDRKRPAPWLIAFAVATFLMSLHSLRHISFLAGAMLYVYVERQSAPTPSDRRNNWRIIAEGLLLTTCCVLALIFDFTGLARAAGQMGRGTWGREDSIFAPALVEALKIRSPAGTAVLCGYGEGAYLTFAGDGRLRPLLDSGLGHFDDATKRSYFFLEREPRAFDLVLSRLNVAHVLITKSVDGWTLALARQTGWRFIDADARGIIFQHDPGNPGLDDDQRRHIEAIRDSLVTKGNFIWAFCFSTLVDPVPSSLEILDRSEPGDLSESFFNYLRPWIEAAPPNELQAFVKLHPTPHNPILRELILMATGARVTAPPAPATQLEKSARILHLIAQGDLESARQDFATLPQPVASTLYYELRDRLAGQPEPFSSARADWQDWNHGGSNGLEKLVPQLNRQLAAPPAPSR